MWLAFEVTTVGRTMEGWFLERRSSDPTRVLGSDPRPGPGDWGETH